MNRDPRRFFTKNQARAIAERQGGLCFRCKLSLKEGYHAHHLVEWAKGGLTEIDNGIALCEQCHTEVHGGAMLQLREWQVRCLNAFREKLRTAMSQGIKPEFRVEACVGSGKTHMMVELFRQLLTEELSEEYPVDIAIFVAPSKAIIGWRSDSRRGSQGIIGTLERRGFWPSERITADSRMPGLMQRPEVKVTDAGIVGASFAFTYAYLCKDPRVIDTLISWASAGCRIAVFYDEIHHVPKIGSAWAESVSRLNNVATALFYFSGTWFRTDGREIAGQISDDGRVEPDFSYSYADGVRDGVVRDVSFWTRDVDATMRSKATGEVVDSRPVRDYLTDIPEHIRDAIFDPDSEFLGGLIETANAELTRRRTKYRDAGCLVVCPPGFHDADLEDSSKDEDRQEDRIAERVAVHFKKATGKRVFLILNDREGEVRFDGTLDATKTLSDYVNSEAEYIVAVNRISEGCDIARLRMCVLFRDMSGTKLMFDQIVGRVIRRRPDDDTEPALVIMPSILTMCEYAKSVKDARAGATPKPVDPCAKCGRIPCSCPCSQCGRKRPCQCPCRDCGEKPCVCTTTVNLDTFVTLENERDAHIIHSVDIADQYAVRAAGIRERVPAATHRDLADMAFILQMDAETNGITDRQPGRSESQIRAAAVQTAASWNKLRDEVNLSVRQILSRKFPDAKNRYQAAWHHINSKFFPGSTWRVVSQDPSQVTVEKLREILAYIERVAGSERNKR